MSEDAALDRAAPTRAGAGAAALRDDAALVMPLWRGQVLLIGEQPAEPSWLPRGALSPLLGEHSQLVFLGQRAGRSLLAAALPADAQVPGHEVLAGRGRFMDLRVAGNLTSRADYHLLAYARGLLQWHRSHSHCPRCGGDTTVIDGGHVRFCDPCDRRHFPRTDPAIMAMIIHRDRILLARQPSWPAGFMSILAGFVEPGESLEEAVVREVREEVGLEVRHVQYIASQPWPFPCSLMIGFAMEATHDHIVIGDDELEAAGFFTREQLLANDVSTPPSLSLAHRLIQRYLAG